MTFKDLVENFIAIIDSAVPLVFALTVAVFIWKISEAWIFGGGDAGKIEQGRKTALVGVIVLTLMVTVWGLVELLRDSIF